MSRETKPPPDPKRLTRLFEALPPHAIEAEMSVLGSILIEPNCIGDIAAILRSGADFFQPRHGVFFDAMLALFEKTGHVDTVTLNQRLADKSLLESVGGQDYLIELATAVPSAASCRHYAKIVASKARVRKFIEAAGTALYDAHNRSDEIDEIINEHQAAVFNLAIADTKAGGDWELSKALDHAVAYMEAATADGVRGIPAGFVELDDLTGGFAAGEMIVLAARPSMGKTALMMNMATNMAAKGRRVGVFSLEMSRHQLVNRMLASHAQVDAQKIRRNMLADSEFRSMCAACGDLRDMPMFIDETAAVNITQLRALATRMKTKHDVQIIFIDYLQLVTGPTMKRENRQVEVSDISRAVKAIARELQIPVVVLAQLNRSPATEMRRPRVSDLRESGSIEQDADVVLLLHREDYAHKEDPEWITDNQQWHNVAELIIGKQRNGPTDTVRLTWCPQITRFRDWTPNRDGPAPVESKPKQAQLQLAGGSDDETEDGLPL